MGQTSHMLQHRESERDVGYKDAVHDVQMNPVGIAAIQHIHLSGQIAEIGGEDGGSNNRFHWEVCYY